MIRSSTMSRVHSAIGRVLALAVELLAELPHQFLLGPGQPFVVDGNGEHTLFVPAVPLDLLDAPTFPAEAGGWKRIAFIRPPPAAARRSR